MESTHEIRRLMKSRTDRMIDGVCGGVAAYAGIDATLVRLAWILLTFLGGSGILLYIAAMIILPKAPAPDPPAAGTGTPKGSTRTNTRFWGILLVGVGLVWLAGNLGFDFWDHWWGLSLSVVLPVLLILAGVAFLFGGREYIAGTSAAADTGESAVSADAPASPPRQRLLRSRTDRKLGGVCGGFGTWLSIDASVVRLAFIAAGFASAGFMVILYIIMLIALPLEPAGEPAPAAPVA